LDRVFLDANVLFSAAYSPESGLLRLWQLKDVTLLTSSYALYEASANLEKPEQKKRLDRLMRSVKVLSEHVDHPLPKGITLPEKDRPILSMAIYGGATHLLTGDVTHFGKYFGKSSGGVLIVRPAQYLKSEK